LDTLTFLSNKRIGHIKFEELENSKFKYCPIDKSKAPSRVRHNRDHTLHGLGFGFA
jgi:hypothetical protein